jgi:hypothetical protein
MTPKIRRAFTFGHALVAAILFAFDFTIPMHHWALDAPLTATALLLAFSVAVALVKPTWAPQALRIAAVALIVFGMGFVTATVLTLAFLGGIHGVFLRHFVGPLTLSLGVSVPYLFVYPLVLLTWVPRQDGKA